MPRITDERREARREQILEAARACLQEHGLEAVSMEMIIARSGLSTGAVYGYFKGKDDIINAVVTDGTAAMGRQLAPILKDPDPPPLPQFDRASCCAPSRTSAATSPAASTGCSCPCTAGATPRATPDSRRPPATAYRRQRELLAETARRWQAAGKLDPGADPGDVAELLQSIILGFVAQRALAGDADVQAHAQALDALTRRCPADRPGGRGAALDDSQQ